MGDPAVQPAISYDLPCPRCSYNLRGLTPEGQCPECGQEITLAFGGNLLRYADPNWVRKIQVGINYEIACVLVLPLALVSETYLAARNFVPVSLVLCTGLARLLFALACFMITPPDPAMTRIPGTAWGIRLIRFSAIIGLVAGICWDVARTRYGLNLPTRVFLYASFGTIFAFFGKLIVLWALARRLHAWSAEEILTIFGWLHPLWCLAAFGAVMGCLTLVFALGHFQMAITLFIANAVLFYLIALADLRRAIAFEIDVRNGDAPNQ